MIKAILFDLDGTLLNTLPDIRRHLNDALTAHGYPAISEEQAKRCIGDGARKLVERAFPAGERFSEEVFEDFSKRYAANRQFAHLPLRRRNSIFGSASKTGRKIRDRYK